MIKNYTIYGERCSGTNYLQELMKENFDIDITWEYGWKHFFGHNNLCNSDNTLFICIIRNINNWLNSLYKTPYHLNARMRLSTYNFLNSECWSFNDRSCGVFLFF